MEDSDALEYPVVRLRGLPYRAEAADIKDFFSGIHLDENNICMIKGVDGRSTGDAFVSFDSIADAQEALKHHNEKIGNRYIEIFRSSPTEKGTYENIRQGNSKCVKMQERLREFMASKPADGVMLRMRGLPFSSTEDDVQKFFDGASVVDSGVFMMYNHMDKPTGECLVAFTSPSDAEDALKYDKKTMGTRYIELFPCSHVEIMHACSGRMKGAGRGGRPNWGSGGPMYGRGGGGMRGGYAGYGMQMAGPRTDYGYHSRDMMAHDRMRQMDSYNRMGMGMHSGHDARGMGMGGMGMGHMGMGMGHMMGAMGAMGAMGGMHDMPQGASSLHMRGDMMSEVGTLPSSLSSLSSQPSSSMAPGSYGIPSGSQDLYSSMGNGFGMGADDTSYSHMSQDMENDLSYLNDYMRGSGASGSGATGGVDSRASAGSAGRGNDYYSQGEVCTLRLRGLPYRITVGEVEDFFRGYDVIPGSVRLGVDPMSGRASGEAFVSFSSMAGAQIAYTEKNRQHIGTRYVEMFFM